MERREFVKGMMGASGLGSLAGCIGGFDGFTLDETGDRVPVRKYASCSALNCDAAYETAVFEVDNERWEVGAAAVENDEDGTVFYRRFDPEEDYLGGDYRLLDVEEDVDQAYSVAAAPEPFHVEVYDTGVEDGVDTGTIELLFEEPVNWGRNHAY